MRCRILSLRSVATGLLTTCLAGLPGTLWAQCGGASSPGNAGSTPTATYNQFGLPSGYNLNSLASNPYNQLPMQMVASQQYHRTMQQMAAMQVQGRSQMIRNQIAQAQAMSRQMAAAGSQMREARMRETGSRTR
jgi:hypothetical protein